MSKGTARPAYFVVPAATKISRVVGDRSSICLAVMVVIEADVVVVSRSHTPGEDGLGQDQQDASTARLPTRQVDGDDVLPGATFAAHGDDHGHGGYSDRRKGRII
jgi:hypothetical protein